MVERLKKLRKEYLNMTQKEFAERIGLKQTSYSEIEHARSNLTERNIKAICQEHNVNENWLRYGIEPVFNEKKEEINILEELKNKYNLNEREVKFTQAFMLLNENNKKMIMNSIFSLTEQYFTNNPEELTKFYNKITQFDSENKKP